LPDVTPREDCIFCGIVGGKVPARVVYEDDRTMAFLDIFPLTRGHTLVIPRRHSVNLLDARTEDVVAVFLSAQHVARLVSDRLGADGVNLLQATGKAAFQTVMHFHVHVLPRYADDGFVLPFERTPGVDAELDDLATRLKS
jgi:histidine triad (HIT) family protein